MKDLFGGRFVLVLLAKTNNTGIICVVSNPVERLTFVRLEGFFDVDKVVQIQEFVGNQVLNQQFSNDV